VAVPGAHSSCSGPLTGHALTACTTWSSGLISVLRGPTRSLRAWASSATVASGLWTTATCRIRSIISFATCSQGSVEEGKQYGITRDGGNRHRWEWWAGPAYLSCADAGGQSYSGEVLYCSLLFCRIVPCMFSPRIPNCH